MSTTAKDKLNAALELIETDLAKLTHPEDRANYIEGIREQLSRYNAAKKRSPHDKHQNAATGDE